MDNTKPVTVRSPLLQEEYTVVRHTSGLTVYLFPKKLTTTYALIATRFGSIDNCFRIGEETAYTTVPDGVAHFLEHKLFENEDGEDTFVKFARTGASANAYTGFRSTAYLFSCVDEIYASLSILLRSVFSPYFTEDNALQYGILQGLYEKHSVRLDIAGTVPSILSITPEVLYRCHKAFYNPANMVLCVCGQADLEKVLTVVDGLLGAVTPIKVESKYHRESAIAYRPRVEKKMQVAKPLFGIGVKNTTPSQNPEERMREDIALQLLAAIGFGKSGAFYHDLYEAGLISPSFDTWISHTPAYSFFSILGDSPDPEEVYRRFVTYTDRLAHSPIPAEDFERCRRALYADFIKSFDSTEEIANNLVIDFALDGCDIFRYGELLQEIDVDTVSRVATSLFRPEAYTLSTVLPVKSS